MPKTVHELQMDAAGLLKVPPLTQRERFFVRFRYGLNADNDSAVIPWREVAKAFHVSPTRARQIVVAGLAKLSYRAREKFLHLIVSRDLLTGTYRCECGDMHGYTEAGMVCVLCESSVQSRQ